MERSHIWGDAENQTPNLMWSELPMAKGWMKLCGAILINDGSLGMTFWGASLHMRDKTAIGNNENLFLSFARNDITGESGCVEHWWRMDALMLEEETSQDNQVCREHNPVGLGDNRLVILSWHPKKDSKLTPKKGRYSGHYMLVYHKVFITMCR